LTTERDNLTRREFMRTSALVASAHVLAGCVGQVPRSYQRRVEPLPPTRRPRLELAQEPPRPAATVTAIGPSPQVFGESVAGLYPGDRMAPWIALTFDDGPRPNWTPRVLRWLGQYGVTATFFVVGRLVDEHPSLVRRIVAEGHDLGNHSYTHRSLASLKTEEIVDELDRTQDAVDAALGRHYPMRLMRPPFGAPWFGSWDDSDQQRVANVLKERNMFCILWHIGTSDTKPTCTADAVVTGLASAITKNRGGAVVFHPTTCAKKSVRAVLRMIRREGVATASPLHLLEAKYGCAWQDIAALPTTRTSS